MSTSTSGIKKDELLLVVASSAALVAAGLDIRLIDAVPCPPSSTGEAANADIDSPKIMVGRLKTPRESIDEARSQLVSVSEVLKAISRMSKEEIAAIIEQLNPAVDDHDHDRFKHEYGVLTIDEMADRMKCTLEEVREREVAGDLFAALTPGRAGDPRYPKFQLSERLDKSLLKQVIQEYRDAGVSTTLLWSFLRSRQKEFVGFTPMEMMLGASPPGYDALTSEEWSAAFLDVVSEELSRVRWIWGSG
ncbi:MAG: hypothetical protein PSV26_11970 [Polaromonas sp.]|uniref:hypothetical protein n=1 Tax=Polaromonas sp. TaxID=1869339 RepID=UPI00248A4BC2|nr:hypothetical protein [Polaromonas sp.]MDI1238191.1 hypothetical protein [Polaromonas sp.]